MKRYRFTYYTKTTVPNHIAISATSIEQATKNFLQIVGACDFTVRMVG